MVSFLGEVDTSFVLLEETEGVRLKGCCTCAHVRLRETKNIEELEYILCCFDLFVCWESFWQAFQGTDFKNSSDPHPDRFGGRKGLCMDRLSSEMT